MGSSIIMFAAGLAQLLRQNSGSIRIAMTMVVVFSCGAALYVELAFIVIRDSG